MSDKLMRYLVKPLFYIFIVLLLVYFFVEMKKVGYLIFADQAKDQPEVASETVLTVEEEDSLVQIGKNLEKNNIIDNAYIFAAALRCSEGYDAIVPGEYVVKSSQKPSEILEELLQKEEKEE